jgi:Fic family protein
MSNWFARHRQEWISETVRIFGFINREHIERKFGVSTPQASADIAKFLHGGGVPKISYNKSTKRYERIDP